jgi:hypothetical protein
MTTTITIAKPITAESTTSVPKGWWPNLERDESRCFAYPRSKRSMTDSECKEILVGIQEWIHGFICPHCGGEHYFLIKTTNVRQCASCHTQTSVISGTFLESVQLPLATWFQAIDAVVNSKESFIFSLAKMLHVKYTTAWVVKNRLQQALKDASERTLILQIAQTLR